MNITAIRSDAIYKKMMGVAGHEKEEIFRNDLMKPFEYKWQVIGVPLKTETQGGYDVITATTMGGGYHPSQITADRNVEVEKISDESFWKACEKSIRDTLEGFEQAGITLKVQDYIFTILLNDPSNQMSAMTGDYCGDGGIPGYIIGTIIPNDVSLSMLPVALAHEANHNVRWQFIQWSSAITLADMIISEGLAENYAALQYGEDKVGRWVSETSQEQLNSIIKPLIHKNFNESDFNKVSGYLYGDEIMGMRGSKPMGVPYCAGYACGYALIKHYLKKTGKNIYEATITSTQDILKEMEDFWSED